VVAVGDTYRAQRLQKSPEMFFNTAVFLDENGYKSDHSIDVAEIFLGDTRSY